MHRSSLFKCNYAFRLISQLIIIGILLETTACNPGPEGNLAGTSIDPLTETPFKKPIYQINFTGIQNGQQFFLARQELLSFRLHNGGAPIHTDELTITLTNSQHATYKLGKKKGERISATLTAILGEKMQLKTNEQTHEIFLKLTKSNQVSETEVTLTIQKGQEKLATTTMKWHKLPVEIVDLPPIIDRCVPRNFKLKNTGNNTLSGTNTTVTVSSNNNSKFSIVGCHQKEHTEVNLSDLFGMQMGLIPGTSHSYKGLSAGGTTGAIGICLLDGQGEKESVVTILVKQEGKIIGRASTTWKLTS